MKILEVWVFKLIKPVIVILVASLVGCANWNKMGDQEKATRKFLAPGTLGLSLILPSSKSCETPACQKKGTLAWAAEVGSIEEVKAFLNDGADANKPGVNNKTPLRLVAHNGRTTIVELLIEENINQQDKNESLVIASSMGYPDIVKILLSHGATPNVLYRKSITALMAAVRDRNIESIYLLMEAEADVNIKDSNGKTAIFYAEGCVECLKALRHE
jgi:ankyrin repeat protein